MKKKCFAGFENIRGTVLAGLAVAVVLLLALAGLSVPLRECLGLQRRSDQLRDNLAEVETLYPLYVDLSSAATGTAWDALPRCSATPLSLADVRDVPDLFSRMASEHDMELASIRPRVVTDTQGQRRLQVDLQVQGSYKDSQAGIARAGMSQRLFVDRSGRRAGHSFNPGCFRDGWQPGDPCRRGC